MNLITILLSVNTSKALSRRFCSLNWFPFVKKSSDITFGSFGFSLRALSIAKHILHLIWCSHWGIMQPWPNNFPILQVSYLFPMKCPWSLYRNIVWSCWNSIRGWMFCPGHMSLWTAPAASSWGLVLTLPPAPTTPQPPAARDPFKAQIWQAFLLLKASKLLAI